MPLYQKKAKSNMSKFQEELVESLYGDDRHITATADKGLGLVRIEVPRYIKDGLVHLSNTKTYRIISEEQDRREILDLIWDIFEWMLKYRTSSPSKSLTTSKKVGSHHCGSL